MTRNGRRSRMGLLRSAPDWPDRLLSAGLILGEWSRVASRVVGSTARAAFTWSSPGCADALQEMIDLFGGADVRQVAQFGQRSAQISLCGPFGDT
jgi:hypothetical protein